MVKLQALLLCDLVVRAPDGKLQLQGIFHVIHVRSLPAQHPAMWLYFRFLVERLSSNGQDTIVVLFKRPSGETEKLPELRVQLDGDSVEGQLQLRGLPLMEEGVHSFELYFNEELVGSCDLTVAKVSPARLGEQHATVQ